MMIMMNIKKGVVLRNNISKTVVPLNYMNLEKKNETTGSANASKV